MHRALVHCWWWIALLIGVVSMGLSPKPVMAQQHAYRQWTVDEGLPSNYVYRVAEDDAGYIWAATERGLARFDGYSWRSYGLADGLAGLDVYHLLRLPSGGLVVGGKGLPLIAIEGGALRPLKGQAAYLSEGQVYLMESFPPVASAAVGRDERKISALYSADSILASTHTSAGTHLPAYANTLFPSLSPEVAELLPITPPGSSAYAIAAPSSNASAAAYGPHGRPPFFLTQTAKARFSGPLVGVSTYVSVRDSVLQLYTPDTLTTIGSDGTVYRLGLGAFAQAFDVNTVMRSRAGDLWVATRAGGVVQVPRTWQDVRLLDATKGKAFEAVERLGTDVYVADDESDVYRYQTGQLRAVSGLEGLPSSRFKQLSLFGDGQHLLAIRYRRYFLVRDGQAWQWAVPLGGYQPPKSILSPPSFYVPENAGLIIGGGVPIVFGDGFALGGTDYLIHLGADSGRFLIKNESTQLVHQAWPKHPELLAAVGNCLVAVDQEGLLDTLVNIRSGQLTAVLPLGEHEFLLGTQAQGVLQVTLAPGQGSPKARHIGVAPDEQVNTLWRDETDGRVWAATYGGVYRFTQARQVDSTSWNVDLHLSRRSGLPTDEVYDLDAVGDSILIATGRGLVMVARDIKNTVPVYDSTLNVQINGLRVRGEARSLKQPSVQLSAGEDDLEFDFELLAPSLAGEIEYRVRLYPRDSVARGQRGRSVRFARLAPGDYELTIEAVTGDGLRYQLAEPLAINLPEPLWQRTWVRLLSLLLLLGGVGGAVALRERARTRRALDRQRRARQTSELQLEALRSQMNPHFIFNALGSIQYFIQSEAKDKADEYLGRFARLMRGFLDGSRRDLTTLDDELELLRQYIELERMRAENSFSYTISVAEYVSEQDPFPSMLLQPFVENAIIHGLATRTDGEAHLAIHISHGNSTTKVLITDNGQGIANSMRTQRRGHRSRATEITEARIKALRTAGIAEVQLGFRQNQPQHPTYPGTIVTLTIQLLHDDV